MSKKDEAAKTREAAVTEREKGSKEAQLRSTTLSKREAEVCVCVCVCVCVW